VFRISIRGSWSFVWGDEPTKPPLATGLKLTEKSKNKSDEGAHNKGSLIFSKAVVLTWGLIESMVR